MPRCRIDTTGVAMSNIAGVRERVQTFLTSEGPVTIDANGRFSIRNGSTNGFIEVKAHGNGEATIVSVLAPLLFGVRLTPELYKYVALHCDDWTFGSLGLWPDETGESGMLVLRHTLLGDYLDKDELMYAVYGVLGTADDIDDELQKQFGGKRYEDT